jgi:regulator of sirC expression with transglutaminase-like and TPR domain
MTNFVRQFSQELQRPAPAPERLALAIAGMAHPDLEMDASLRLLDNMAAQMALALDDVPPGRRRAEHFMHVFTHDLGFCGNRENYYEPANSFLNLVLHERTGLPIMLSLVCLVIAQRIDADVVGVGFPGHFMARYTDAQGSWLLDPFNDEVVECADAESYLSRVFQHPRPEAVPLRSTARLPAEAHAPVSPAALAQRILNNLRNVYLSRSDYRMAACVADYLLVLAPHDAALWQERGLLHFYSEQWDKAIFDLKRYFFFKGQLMLALSHEHNAKMATATLEQQEQQLLEIFYQIEETRRRIN